MNASQQQWHAIDARAAWEQVGSGPEGLTEAEAGQRLGRFGANQLRAERKASPLRVFLTQFRQFLILILIAAALVSLFLGETIDAIVILLIIAASALLGFAQEFRSERALEALRKFVAPTATVIRSSHEKRVRTTDVVQGDVLVLAPGDKIAADARLFQVYSLQTNEASLTGESTPVEKGLEIVRPEAPLGERMNMVFAGTTVTYGKGLAVVVATGMNAELGKIASMVQSAERAKTPLEMQTESLGKTLGGSLLAVVAGVTLLGLGSGESLVLMFLWGVSLAVAAVPEALPAVVTGALALGVQRMARRRAIVRKLPAIETLGSTTVICSDKTGTMTKGEMTVSQIYWAGRSTTVSGVGYNRAGDIKAPDSNAREASTELLMFATLCSDAKLESRDSGFEVLGDPTEGALLVAAMKAGLDPKTIRAENPRVGEVPFSSERKMMTTAHRRQDDSVFACSKGATEVILQHCRFEQNDGGNAELTEKGRARILRHNGEMAENGLRVLGVARRELPSSLKELDESEEKEFVFLGLVGMLDPPREEAVEALHQCLNAGIRTVMITGDHKLTAMAVARQLGLLGQRKALTGEELDRLDDSALGQIVDDIAVYARVSPHHKVRVVKALRKRGHVVAMTGDGVNDAPALVSADIGVSMGITGTEVAKEASAMVLLDDNFATLVDAVREGRSIYDNVKKYLAFLLACNIGEILIMFLARLQGYLLPLLPIQILWVNLVTDGLPAIALGVDPPDPGVMDHPPRPKSQSIFTGGVLMNIGVVSLLMSIGALAVLNLYNPSRLDEGPIYIKSLTIVLTLVVMFEMFNAFNCRSDHNSILTVGPFKNRYLLAAVASSVVLQVLVVYVPELQGVFDTSYLALNDWLLILVLATSVILGVEVGKRILHRKSENPGSSLHSGYSDRANPSVS